MTVDINHRVSNVALRRLQQSQNGAKTVPVSYFSWQLDPDVTVGRALVAATQRLHSAGHSTPRLDGEVLLAHALGSSKTQLYAYPERQLTDVERRRFEELVDRRFKHEPVAYLIGRKAFYGLELTVDQRVLIPRPETELLVDLALDLVGQADRQSQVDGHLLSVSRSLSPARPLSQGNGNGRGDSSVRSNSRIQVADVGTGSGAIALAIAANTRETDIYAIDVSSAALALASENAVRNGLSHRVRFLQGDLLAPLPGPVNLIVANLPYVALSEWPDLALDIAQFEPSLALAGGADGLEIIRRLLGQAPGFLLPEGALLLEIGAAQGAAVAGMAAHAFPGALVEVLTDYGNRDRIVRVQT